LGKVLPLFKPLLLVEGLCIGGLHVMVRAVLNQRGGLRPVQGFCRSRVPLNTAGRRRRRWLLPAY
jgi:hypothetical protein